MRNVLRRAATCLLPLTAACANNVAPTEFASEESRSGKQTEVAHRAAALDLSNPSASYVPVPGMLDAGGRLKVTWDGSMADLLAADALAACWSSLPNHLRIAPTSGHRSSFVTAVDFGDPILSDILDKMDAAICPQHRMETGTFLTRPVSDILDGWLDARNDPDCSFDVSSREGVTLDLRETRSSLAADAWTPPSGVPEEPLREAQAELGYADLYMCMTERLVEHTKSSFIFEAGAEDVLRLYDLARNRSLLTVYQYSLLAKVFAIDPVALQPMATEDYGTIAALKHWADSRTDEQQGAAGRDLALAIDTLSALTKRQVELLRRDASREGGSFTPGGARSQILRTLYGDSAPEVGSVSEALGAPEIGILLGLLRAADALDLEVSVRRAPEHNDFTVNREATALAMLRSAEAELRAQTCPDDEAGCAHVSQSEHLQDYKLQETFGIGLEHAERLVGALSEAVFGLPATDELTYTLPPLPVAPEVGQPVSIADGRGPCAIFDNGRVACWIGMQGPTWIELASGGPLANVVGISMGDTYACGVNAEGKAFCWGFPYVNGAYAVGAAAAISGLPSPDADPVRQVAVSYVGACAVTLSGDVYCWGPGAAASGTVGDGTHAGPCTATSECGAGTCHAGQCLPPSNIGSSARKALVDDVKHLAAGGRHVCALRRDGEVYCWGDDSYGELGLITGAYRTCSDISKRCYPTPKLVSVPSSVGKVVALTAQDITTCALTAEGKIFCWGASAFMGAYSPPYENTCRFTPCTRTPQSVKIDTQPIDDAVSFGSGASHSCARLREDGIACWGDNSVGQLGLGHSNYMGWQAQMMPSSEDYLSVATGNQQTCVITASSELRCWGASPYGLQPTTVTTPTSAPPAMSVPVSSDRDVVMAAAAKRRAPFHLLGKSAASDAGADIHLSKDFQLIGLSSQALQMGASLRHIPVRDLDVTGPARGQGFLYRRFVVADPAQEEWGANAFQWGSVSTLALARESILQVADANESFFQGAAPALELLEYSIGNKAAILRKKTEVRDAPWSACMGVSPEQTRPNLPADAVLGRCREVSPIQGGARTLYDLSVVTDSEDPNLTIAFGTQVPNVFEKAMSLEEEGADELRETTQGTLATVQEIGAQEIRDATFVLLSPAMVLFEQGSPSRTDSTFLPIFDGSLRELGAASEFIALDGAIVAYGGSLNAMASEAFAVDPQNWSRPRYDAFGLPTDWVPSADPALLGSSGEEPYQYFLRVAKDTAREATNAIQDAFSAARQEQFDGQALSAANERAAALRKTETELLCGSAACPPLSWTRAVTTDDVSSDCVLENFAGYYFCEDHVLALRQSSHQLMSLPTVVWEQRNARVPSFGNLASGEQGKQLLSAWTALRRVRDTFRAGTSAIRTSTFNLFAAEDEVNAAQADIGQAKVQQELQEISLASQRESILLQVAQLEAQLTQARGAESRYCGEAAFERAVKAGYSYPEAGSNVDANYHAKGISRPLCYRDGESGNQVCETLEKLPGSWDYDVDEGKASWSAGSVYAWSDQCQEAKRQVKAASAVATDDALRNLNAIVNDIGDIGSAMEHNIAYGVQAASARAAAATNRWWGAASQEREVFFAQVSAVQEAQSALLAATHELTLATQRTELAKARYDLDRQLSSKEIATRQQLRRRYEGFSQWRADAMAENARRTAVAARRAIESRFAVDLSELGNDEPFVAPPSVWADDVYERDLKPPAAVGTTRFDEGSSDGQVYGNKLIDYVNNLELFVAGYAIERPTSAARNDSEVLSLPAPATRAEVQTGNDAFFFPSATSHGWRFVCASGDILPNPTYEYNDSSRFQDMCPNEEYGEPPVRAVLTFWMDPWGRVGGNPFSEPFVARHNARWRQLAINLVGTGIRDCQYATDPAQCYAEPFLRFDLRHVGPAWVTGYDLKWMPLVIPSAVIEDGKALAFEEWLDPVSRGWSVPEVQAVARSELSGRPLGGTYELSIELTPDVQLPAIERIQVLTSVDYWVRQN